MSVQPPDDSYALIKGLRVVRNYRPEPVSPTHIQAILEAGRWTGSSKNRQGWAFLIIDDAEQQQRLAECGRYTQPLRDATFVVVPVRLPDGYEWDVGRLSQNMMLAAWSLGIGSCPITLHDTESAHEVLGLPPGHEAGYALCFGYPDDQAEAAARATKSGGRKPLEELIVRNRWS